MTALIVFALGVALIAILAAHNAWEDIHDDSENEK